MQTALFKDNTDGLCGFRGAKSYADATRTQKASASSDYYCPSGMLVCSDDFNKNGTTYCVDDISECPVTALFITDESNSRSFRQNPKYVVKESANGHSPLYVAFTKTDDVKNSPIQSLGWDWGRPCAHTDQSDDYATTNLTLYVLEQEHDKPVCTAIDFRYEDYSKMEVYPNEYDVQSMSGVFDLLKAMFQYDTYVPDAVAEKKKVSYHFWGRKTLDFVETCEAGDLQSAIALLSKIGDDS